MKEVTEVQKNRPNFLDPAGPITSETLKKGLEQIDAGKFDEAWRSFCLLAEQIDFISWTIHDVAPDDKGNFPQMNPAYAGVDKHVSEANQSLDALYYDFWAAFVPPEDGEGK
jgi:hypothetical protein